MRRRCRRRVLAASAVAAGSWLVASAPSAEEQVGLQRYEVSGDAIVRPLTGTPGDPARGQRIVGNRALGLCLLCHRGPFPEEAQGTRPSVSFAPRHEGMIRAG